MSTPAAPSFVRTLVPIAVGQAVAYLATLGITVPENVETAFTVVLGFVVASAYYAAIRFLEQKWPKLGALLGWAATPNGYTSAGEIPDTDNAAEVDIDDSDDVPLDELADGDEPIEEDLEALAAAEVDGTPVPEDYRPRH